MMKKYIQSFTISEIYHVCLKYTDFLKWFHLLQSSDFQYNKTVLGFLKGKRNTVILTLKGYYHRGGRRHNSQELKARVAVLQ